jgi:hypothetical protein
MIERDHGFPFWRNFLRRRTIAQNAGRPDVSKVRLASLPGVGHVAVLDKRRQTADRRIFASSPLSPQRTPWRSDADKSAIIALI